MMRILKRGKGSGKRDQPHLPSWMRPTAAEQSSPSSNGRRNGFESRTPTPVRFATGEADYSSEEEAILKASTPTIMAQDAEDGPETLFSASSDSQYFINATRLPMNQDEFDSRFSYQHSPTQNKTSKRNRKFLRRYYRPFLGRNEFLYTLISFIPIIGWLPTYDWKNNFLCDFLGGLTVGVLHVPQGIAYALLAEVNPVVGLYTSFFPSLLYMLFGTSRHNSIGSFAVVSLMTGITVQQLIGDTNTTAVMSSNGTVQLREPQLSPEVVASSLALCVGLIHILMGILRLEIITTYFSDQLVSGFTTAASFHVFASQLKDLFGILSLPQRTGAGYLFLKFYDIFANLAHANLVTVFISAYSITFLILGKEVVTPLLRNRFKLTTLLIPWELILLVKGTFVSWAFHLHTTHNVSITNMIPTGMPAPMLPDVHLLPVLMPSALSIAVVVVAVHISLAKMFAKKEGYEVDPGQEFYALGFSSSLSSLFPVYPVSCSLGRTMVNVEAGTKTQFSTISSAFLLGAVILYFGRWLRTLPMCILSSIVIVALKSILRKITDLWFLWPLSKIDCSIFVVSFVATFAWDVSQGLAVSIAFALLTTVFRTQWPRWHFLSNLIGTNDFRDSERYNHTINHPGICIFRFDSPLLFTNVDRFKANIRKAFHKWNDRTQKRKDKTAEISPNISSLSDNLKDSSTKKSLEVPTNLNQNGKLGRSICFRHFVIDCSGFTFVDCMGVNALKEIFTEMRNEKVLLYFAAAKGPVRDLFEKCGFYQYVPKHNFYPTIRDAVAIARKRRNASTLQLLQEQVDQFDAVGEAINIQPMD